MLSKEKILIIAIFLSAGFLITPKTILAKQIDINSATLSQLDELTGIGPTYAQRIIDNRPYSSVDDLLKVKGIGSATLQKIKEQNWACVDCQTTEDSDSQSSNPDQTSNTQSDTQTNNSPPIDTNSDQIISSESTPSPTPAPAPSFQYSENIFINEFLPYPEKDEKEWVELYNSSSETINLTGWRIDDEENSTSPLTIPSNTEIEPGEFLVITMTKSMFNNDGDKIRLLWPDNQIIHSISYQNAKKEQTCARFETQWFWTSQPTPGQANKKSSIEVSTIKNASSPPPQILTKEEIAAEDQPISGNLTKNISATPQNSKAPETKEKEPGIFASQFSASQKAKEQTKEPNQSLKIFLTVSAIVILAALTGSGLVFFRRREIDRQKTID